MGQQRLALRTIPMISFSTCWNSSRHTDGYDMIVEILEMGFDTIEVSHGLNISLIPGIRRAFSEGIIKVSGVHNFCPSPVEVLIDAPDCYEFSSHRSFDRERATLLTRKSLQTAADLGGQYLVMHMGSVPMKPFTEDLEQFMKEGEIHSREFVKTKLKSITAREKQAGLYYRRAIAALEDLIGDAEKYGVKLAIESRSHFEQVPSEREMTSLQEHFRDTPWVGYWHDIGHVQRKANIGYLDHFQWLSSMQPFLIGCHLHDVQWPHRDHRVPMTAGGVDYDRLMPIITPEKPVVWELSYRRRKKTIIEALGKWERKFGY